MAQKIEGGFSTVMAAAESPPRVVLMILSASSCAEDDDLFLPDDEGSRKATVLRPSGPLFDGDNLLRFLALGLISPRSVDAAAVDDDEVPRANDSAHRRMMAIDLMPPHVMMMGHYYDVDCDVYDRMALQLQRRRGINE